MLEMIFNTIRDMTGKPWTTVYVPEGPFINVEKF